jgi:glycosyltransferase involved in cell wall biosynthesis
LSITVSVVVGTYGGQQWVQLAEQRALPSVLAQTAPCEVIHVHGPSLHEARNEGAARAGGEWLVFLDADDELDRHYVAAMLDAVDAGAGERLFQPATLGVVEGVEDDAPVLLPERPLLEANYLVIGTMVAAAQFSRVGGFGDWSMFEDWDLWIRCWLEGARVQSVPGAVYRVHVMPSSRNRQLSLETYHAIRRTYTRR